MIRVFTAILTVISLYSVTIAQSGRRITPAPTPAVAERPAQAPELDYSESKPQKPRERYLRPALRTVEGGSGGAKVTEAAPETIEGDDVVRVETNLVTIPVSVFDRNGLYIPGLKESDFKIFEDGREQEIAYFGTTDKPFTVIILIDTSPSTAYKIEEIQEAARAFVDQLKPQDSVMVIEFDAGIHVLTEATNDRGKIYKAIRKADFGNGTSLYDAVDYSLRKKLSKVAGRKAIVLFTDGVDTTSMKANFDHTIDLAEESDSLIFPIYYNTFFDNRLPPGSVNFPMPGRHGGMINTRGTKPSDYALGRRYLEELSSVTGGRVFRPEATPGGLTAAFEGIAEELRRQYNIGYVPDVEGKRGQRKQIKVRVNRPNLVLRARDSYIVGAAVKTEPAPVSK